MSSNGFNRKDVIFVIVALQLSSLSSAGALIGHTVNSNEQLTQIKSNGGFLRRGETGVPRRKPLGAEKRTNKLNPHMTPDLGIKPRPHWWEMSALTTAHI